MSWFPVWGYLHGTEARSLFVYSQSITVFPLRLNDYVATTLRLIIFVWIRSEVWVWAHSRRNKADISDMNGLNQSLCQVCHMSNNTVGLLTRVVTRDVTCCMLSAVLRTYTPPLIHLNFRPPGLGKGLDSFPGTPATSFYDPQSPPSARWEHSKLSTA